MFTFFIVTSYNSMGSRYAFIYRKEKEEYPTAPGTPMISHRYTTTGPETRGYGPTDQSYASLYYYNNPRDKLKITGGSSFG